GAAGAGAGSEGAPIASPKSSGNKVSSRAVSDASRPLAVLRARPNRGNRKAIFIVLARRFASARHRKEALVGRKPGEAQLGPDLALGIDPLRAQPGRPLHAG